MLRIPSTWVARGAGGAGSIVAVASAILDDAVSRRVIDTGGFRFSDVRRFDDVNFVPGMVKYGDLPGLLALTAPYPLWIYGEDGLPDVVDGAYRAARAAGNIHSGSENLADVIHEAFLRKTKVGSQPK